tara:strand:+ start:119 stop:265 length:147 start_codon:yes stop_codon:yes gene_type:complete
MMSEKYVEFKDQNFVITDKGRNEMERLLILSGNKEELVGKRISTSIGS